MLRNYATFKQAVSLKKNGYTMPSILAFNEDGTEKNIKSTYLSYNKGEDYIDYNYFLFNNNEENTIIRPLQSDIVDWLKVIHNIHIWVQPYDDSNDKEVKQILYEFKIINIDDEWNDCSDYTFYNTSEEAYSAGFDYIFENLLKTEKLTNDKVYIEEDILKAYLKGLEDAHGVRLYTKENIINKFKKETFGK